MRLAELIKHTSLWVGMPEAQVRTVARILQPVGLISSAGRNPRGAELHAEDKINLLLGVCGVEVAGRAADYVRVWRRLIRYGEGYDLFHCTQTKNVSDFLVSLITKDLVGTGPLIKWMIEPVGAHEFKYQSSEQLLRHFDSDITLDFYVDEFSLKLVVNRHRNPPLQSVTTSSTTDSIEVHFWQPPPGEETNYEYHVPRQKQGFSAPSQLIRRLNGANLRGWGTCLTE